jgi:pSer/pThr/pTyr-binding forkhead associated (FHA) protein
MKKVTLHIEAPDGEHTASLDDELTVGRTEPSNVILDDAGLSRRNTTFFCDEDEILVVDEGSLNGTFLNGEQILGSPRVLHNGDQIKIGSGTTIRVQIVGDMPNVKTGTVPVEKIPSTAVPALSTEPAKLTTGKPVAKANGIPTILIAAGVMSFLIIFGALIAVLIMSRGDNTTTVKPGKNTPQIMRSSLIPLRVIDPLGGEDEDDLDDLIASWETEEKEIDATSVADVAVTAANTEEADLSVTAAFLADRQKKAFEQRNAETGIRPAGLNPPKELLSNRRQSSAKCTRAVTSSRWILPIWRKNA